MLKLFLHFYSSLLRVNLLIAVPAGFIGMAFGQEKMADFINGFSLLLLTGGFLAAVYVQEGWHSNQYFFYHNRGLSRVQLLAGAYAINLVVVFTLLILKMNLYA